MIGSDRRQFWEHSTLHLCYVMWPWPIVLCQSALASSSVAPVSFRVGNIWNGKCRWWIRQMNIQGVKSKAWWRPRKWGEEHITNWSGNVCRLCFRLENLSGGRMKRNSSPSLEHAVCLIWGGVSEGLLQGWGTLVCSGSDMSCLLKYPLWKWALTEWIIFVFLFCFLEKSLTSLCYHWNLYKIEICHLPFTLWGRRGRASL